MFKRIKGRNGCGPVADTWPGWPWRQRNWKAVSVRVINVSTIKPMDLGREAWQTGCRAVVTAEEHNVRGGLGSTGRSPLQEPKP